MRLPRPLLGLAMTVLFVTARSQSNGDLAVFLFGVLVHGIVTPFTRARNDVTASERSERSSLLIGSAELTIRRSLRYYVPRDDSTARSQSDGDVAVFLCGVPVHGIVTPFTRARNDVHFMGWLRVACLERSRKARHDVTASERSERSSLLIGSTELTIRRSLRYYVPRDDFTARSPM